jgi:allophanate hydrolase
MDMTINAIHQAYRNGTLSPHKLIDDVLARARTYAERHIWITLLSREAIQPYLDNLIGHSPDKLPLYGIPFAIKDNIELAGVDVTAGCEAYRYTAEQSAHVVELLINAGAIPIGKTNMDQFATGLVGVRSPDKWGACQNSFDPEYISGGSSSGSAVAVALGLVSFSLGTDTAGSGRVPAAFNNLIGLKPSRGLLSNHGVVPACKSLDCVSIFSLTTDDANRVFEVAAAFDSKDDYSRHNKDTNRRNYGQLAADSFNFAIPQAGQLAFFGDQENEQGFYKTVETLKKLGGFCHEIDFEPFLTAARLLYEGPWVAERRIATANVKREAMLPVLQQILDSNNGASAEDLFSADYQLQHCKQQVTPALENFDFILTPTAGTIYKIKEVQAEPIKLNSQLGYYTNFMNLLDCSAIAVPAGFNSNGLPFGVTLFSRAFSDTRLLSYANQLQQTLKLPLGATSLPLAESQALNAGVMDRIQVVVCGAHLEGQPLNWQLRERGGKLIRATQTSSDYRLYALPGGPPARPGLVRDEQQGEAIEVELWELPTASFGSFVAGIPAPLGIGKVQLADQQWYTGFICEPYAIPNATDISHLKGWRAYVQQQ